MANEIKSCPSTVCVTTERSISAETWEKAKQLRVAESEDPTLGSDNEALWNRSLEFFELMNAKASQG